MVSVPCPIPSVQKEGGLSALLPKLNIAAMFSGAIIICILFILFSALMPPLLLKSHEMGSQAPIY
jgi:hypothetical protein